MNSRCISIIRSMRRIIGCIDRSVHWRINSGYGGGCVIVNHVRSSVLVVLVVSVASSSSTSSSVAVCFI